MMASIQRRQGTRGTTYRVMWRSADGNQQSRTVGNLQAARRLVAEMAIAEQERRAPSRASSRITLDAWAAEILSSKSLKPKTAATYEELLRSRILPTFGATPLERITRSAIRAWVAETAREVSARRTQNAHALLRHLLEEAVSERLLDRNPASRIPLPRSQSREVQPWTIEELAAVADACHGYKGLVLWLGIMGTRWAETIGLRRSDFSNGLVNVSSSLSEVRGHFVRVPTKSYRTRRLPVPGPLLAFIPQGPGELVFTSPRGMPLRSGQFRDRHFRPACARTGVRPIRLHDLRHTAASLLSMHGTSPTAIQVWLGHRNLSVTMNTYLHAFPHELEDAARGLMRRVLETQEGPTIRAARAG